ncbi:MAG TPA: nitroreductase [Leptospiraceae bacterium]|nr:nitroreductase [Leptospiraceae bacterium]
MDRPVGTGENMTQTMASTKSLESLIEERYSCRGFLPDGIDRTEIEKMIELAERAPSWKNAQSYKIVALTGEKKEALCRDLIERARSGAEPAAEIPYETGYPSSIRRRMMDLAVAFFAQLGIDRKDKEAREKQTLRNFNGFGAPVMLFAFIPAGLREWTILDLGVFFGHLTLVVRSHGYESILQAALAAWPDIVRKHTGVGAEYTLVVGMSIGKADPSEPANHFKSQRAPASEILQIL